MANAGSRPRLAAATPLGEPTRPGRHFVAVSTNAAGGRGLRHRPRQHVRLLGLGRRPLLALVGDRPVADASRIGPERFARTARRLPRMDEHFRTAPLEAQRCRCCWPCSASGTAISSDAQTHAVLPYDQYLTPLPGLPAAARHGEQRQVGRPRRPSRSLATPARSSGASPAPTASTPSTSCCTRGPSLVPGDFIGFAEPTPPRIGDHHDLLLANLLAQTEALAFGKTGDEVRGRGRRTTSCVAAPRPSTATGPPTRSWPTELTPARPGPLIALYEHKIFVQGVDLEHQLLRPVGRRAGQEAGRAPSCPR